MTTKSEIQLGTVSLKPQAGGHSGWLHLAVVDSWHGLIWIHFKMGILGPEIKH